MKFFFLFLLSFNLYAVELIFIGPCDEEFIMRTEVSVDYTNVGELTIETLKKFSIPFKGTAEGLASAFNTPTGKEAVEVISSEESRAYGWCFSVDGEAPDLYPHEVSVTRDTKKITWHFGFARNVRGQWITQCTPSYTVRPAFLCEDPTAE
jgi:hypothetical protein